MPSARILYLDDEEPLVFIVKRMLERIGHRVSGFTRADDALAAFAAAPDTFDLVITDMSMPGMSGIDFANAVLAAHPQALVVIASGYVDERETERALAAVTGFSNVRWFKNDTEAIAYLNQQAGVLEQ